MALVTFVKITVHLMNVRTTMNNPYFISIIGFVLMAFSAGWLGLATFLGVPGFSIVGIIGVLLFTIGIGIVIYMLSSIKNIEVKVIDE
mgnify:CR=1 FL=1|tara:strand:+ start:2665 stop:2928 length:264 start_codon:yes stop_codon:yes gene_type:complete